MTVFRLVCLSTVLLVLAGCRKAEEKKPPAEPVAPGDLAPGATAVDVDGATLTFAEMSARADRDLKYAQDVENLMFHPSRLPEAKVFYRKRAVKAFVYRTVMLNEASRLGITINEKERAEGFQKLARSLNRTHSATNDYFSKGPQPPDVMMSDFNDRLVIEKLLNKAVQQGIKVMDADVEQGIEEIAMTNAVRRATLETALKQIADGAPFEDVARAISQDGNSAKNGGDLGEFPRGKYKDQAFDDAVFRLPVGQVSEVVETKFGYHLFKVAAHNPAQTAKDGVPAVPETVRASHILIKALPVEHAKIAHAIYNRKFLEGARDLYEALKAKAKIECPMYSDMVYDLPTLGN